MNFLSIPGSGKLMPAVNIISEVNKPQFIHVTLSLLQSTMTTPVLQSLYSTPQQSGTYASIRILCWIVLPIHYHIEIDSIHTADYQ